MSNENMAVNIVDDIISQTDLLEPFFNRGDKEPSWDGFIYAYNSKQKKADQMYGRAATQIKSTSKNPKKKDRITSLVRYDDMENYRDDGGVIYFVVYIDEEKNREIYHAALLPYTLNALLEKHKGKKKFALHLYEFPKSPKDIENLVINFVENCQRQASPSRKNWTFEELVENFNIQSPKIKYHFTDVYKYKDPMDYLFEHFTEMYVPVDVIKQEVPIGSAKLEFIQSETRLPVKVGNKLFYDSYIRRRDKNGYTISIGDGVLTIRTTNSKTVLSFKVVGTLPDQIKAGELVLSVFDAGCIKLGKDSISIDINSISKEDKINIENLRKRHLWNKDLQEALCRVGVKGVLSFKNWSEKDVFYASQLIKSILYNEPVRLPDFLEGMSIIRIGNIDVGVLNQRLETGLFSMVSMFDDKQSLLLVVDKDKTLTSPYVVLNYENILSLSNINYEVIYKSIKRFHSEEHYLAVNGMLLQMLLAYDKQGGQELLNAAIRIAKWLHQEDSDNPYFLINWYQCIYRKRKKDKRIDSKILLSLIETGDNDIRIGAAIIAGKHELAKELMGQMSKEKQEEFFGFPIVSLLT